MEWDDQGRPLRWTTVTEPEFDAEERDSWEALWEYEQEICDRCGNFRVICSDPEGLKGEGFHPLKSVCWVSAAYQVALRRWGKQHENARPDTAGYLPTDGVRITVGLYDDPARDPFPRKPMNPLLAPLLAATET